MQTAPNQRVITTQKQEITYSDLYAKMNLNALNQAMQVLRPNAFKLWVYFNKNQNGYKFALSKVDVIEKCHMTNNTYLSAFKELEDLGYLVATSRTHFIFYEKPITTDEKTITIVKEIT